MKFIFRALVLMLLGCWARAALRRQRLNRQLRRAAGLRPAGFGHRWRASDFGTGQIISPAGSFAASGRRVAAAV